MMKEEIIQRLSMFISDERKIEFLENLLKKPMDLDKETRVFVYFLLSEIYERKKFYEYAVKYLLNAEKLVSKYNERIPLLMKISRLYVKLFNFINAEEFFNMAKNDAPESAIPKLTQQYYNFYLEEAEMYELKKFYRKAIRLYEYLAKNNFRKIEMLKKMIELYDKAGMPIEANRIRRQLQDYTSEKESLKKEMTEERVRIEGRADMLI